MPAPPPRAAYGGEPWNAEANETLPAAIFDIGAHRVACLLVFPHRKFQGEGAGTIRHAVVRSAGYARGKTVTVASLQTAMAAALQKAAGAAGLEQLQTALIVSCFASASVETFASPLGAGKGLTDKDRADLFDAAVQHGLAHRQQVGQVFSRSVPGSEGASNPTEVVAVSVPTALTRPLAVCGSALGSTSSEFMPATLAAAYAVTSERQRQEGVAVIDMGGHSTSAALFADGVPLCIEAEMRGGHDVTSTIAQVFQLRPFAAERLKIKHGSAFSGLIADRDLPVADGAAAEPVSKLRLNEVIRHEASQHLQGVYDRLTASGYSSTMKQTVLTGGASQLPGLTDVAQTVFRSPVRLGRVERHGVDASPSLAAAYGALAFVSQHHWRQEIEPRLPQSAKRDGYAARISHWLKMSF